jgi:hypothetical protein
MSSKIATLNAKVKALLATITYAQDSGYADADVMDLVQINKFPFYNVICEGYTVGNAGNIKMRHLERWTYSILIQCAVQAMTLNVARVGDDTRVGIYEFTEDIRAALKSDTTLDGEVYGMEIDSSIDIDVSSTGRDTFIGAAEIRIKYYEDEEA